ncbi:MAG: hypothetical protein AAF329_07610, partial [Cyanobacteria bacterium P01_A01_bin.17]
CYTRRTFSMDQKPAPESFVDYAWIVMVSDKGMTLKFSDKAMGALGRQLYRALPWILTSLTTLGGTAGVRILLQQQQGTPATSPTEDVLPQP